MFTRSLYLWDSFALCMRYDVTLKSAAYLNSSTCTFSALHKHQLILRPPRILLLTQHMPYQRYNIPHHSLQFSDTAVHSSTDFPISMSYHSTPLFVTPAPMHSDPDLEITSSRPVKKPRTATTKGQAHQLPLRLKDEPRDTPRLSTSGSRHTKTPSPLAVQTLARVSKPAAKTKSVPNARVSSATMKDLPQLASSSSTNDNEFKGKLGRAVTVLTRGKNGGEMQTTVLHTDKLRYKSPVLFRKATESATNELKELDLDSAAFAIFGAWFYSAKVDLDVGEDPDSPVPDQGDVLASVLECYCLSEALEATDFGHAVMTKACQLSDEHGLKYDHAVINKIYQRTAAGSALRRWIVDAWVWQFDNENVADLKWNEEKALTKEFLFDVMKAQAKRLGKKAWVSIGPPSKVAIWVLIVVAEAPGSS